jgi:hypothetical protein
MAATLFRRSFDEIFLTFAVFTGLVVLASRFGRGRSSQLAGRLAVAEEVEFTDDGVSLRTDHAHSRWPWSSLDRLHVLDSVVALEFRDWAMVTLPNRLWIDQAAKESFVESLRARVPHLEPDLSPASVPSPFTLINVSAGFGAMDLFCGLLIVVVRMARVECGCSVSWQVGGQSVPFAVLYGSVIAISVAAFFPIRYALRALDRRQHIAAAIAANLLIWPVPVALIVFAIVR